MKNYRWKGLTLMRLIKKIMYLMMITTILFSFHQKDTYHAEKMQSTTFSPIQQQIFLEFRKHQHNKTSKRKVSSYKEDEVIIKSIEKLSKLEIESLENQFRVRLKRETETKKFLNFQLKEGALDEATLRKLNLSPLVEYAEPNYVHEPAEVNDPLFDKQWGLKEESGIDINVEPAWEITKGSSSVVVAVIDTGVDLNHPDLKDRIWTNNKEIKDNGIDDDNNGFIDDSNGWDFKDNENHPMDEYGHGTHVSGIIAASENEVGIIGVAPKVTIMPIRVGDKLFSSYDILQAIEYAKNNGAHIINMSYGSYGKSIAEEDAIRSANNLLSVAAAGNNGTNNDSQPFYPASYPLGNLVSVGLLNPDGSNGGNYGSHSVDIVAPGSDIYSTVPGGLYDNKSGTSMSAPHVTGVAALLKTIYSSLEANKIKEELVSEVTYLPDLRGRVKAEGMLNAGKVVNTDYTEKLENQLIWEDRNGNGKLDLWEPVLPQIQIELYKVSGEIVESVLTDVNGRYAFTQMSNLSTNFYIEVSLPSQYSIVTTRGFGRDGRTGYIKFNDVGLQGFNIGVKNHQLASIKGKIWSDNNLNGELDAESPLKYVESLHLIDASTNEKVVTIFIRSTDYEFTDVKPGLYYIQFGSTTDESYFERYYLNGPNSILNSEGKSGDMELSTGEIKQDDTSIGIKRKS